MSLLRQYTCLHFKTDERPGKQDGYSKFQDHAKLHRELTLEAKETTEEAIESRDPDFVLKFLKHWWLIHINKEDKKYVPQVKKMLETP